MSLYTSKAGREFLTLLGVALLTLAVMYAPQPLLSTVQKNFPHYSDATIALVMTFVLLPLGIAPLIYGSFLSSLSTKTVLQVCVFTLGLSCIGMYFFTSFPALLACRLVHGLVSPAVLTCIMAHISAKFKNTLLQQAMAIYIGTTIIGGLVGRIGSGAVATIWDWQTPFLVLALTFFAMLIPLKRLRKRAKAKISHIKFSEFGCILRTPGMKRLLYIDGCGFFCFVALATYLPFFLTSIDESSSEWRISLMYLGYGIGVLVAFTSRALSAFVGSRVKTIRLGIVIYMSAMGLFLIHNPIFTFFAMFLVCAGQFMEHSISPGLINRISVHDKGAVNGIYLSVYYMGGALGSYFPGLIYTAFGWDVLIMCICMALVTVLAATLGLEKHTPVQ